MDGSSLPSSIRLGEGLRVNDAPTPGRGRTKTLTLRQRQLGLLLWLGPLLVRPPPCHASSVSGAMSDWRTVQRRRSRRRRRRSIFDEDEGSLPCSEGSTSNNIAVACVRSTYEDVNDVDPLDIVKHISKDTASYHDDDDDGYLFPRFQSPASIQRLIERVIVSCRRHPRRGGSNISPLHPFQKYQGTNHREGLIRSHKLSGTDWVVAESKQVALDCTPEEVLETYLSGALQEEWNRDKVKKCTITRRFATADDDTDRNHNYYQQDLVLRPQRIITSSTGVMRYSQKITVDKILGNGNQDGHDKNNMARYCISIQLWKEGVSSTTTKKKPFEALSVYVHLEPKLQEQQREETAAAAPRCNVHIYAAGIMKVNRQVVPNLGVFDASGIAGSMAGKGTLWLSGYFQQRQLAKEGKE